MGKHTPPSDQRRLVELWLRSPGSRADFARSHGVLPSTFSSWIHRHRTPCLEPEEWHFLPVTAPVALAADEAVAVQVGQHTLRFDSPPPATWFAAVIRELAPC